VELFFLKKVEVERLVQSFYEKKRVNLKQIATQTVKTVSSTEKFALYHTKSPKKSLRGKYKKLNSMESIFLIVIGYRKALFFTF